MTREQSNFNKNFHSPQLNELYTQLNTDPDNGLSSKQVKTRSEKYSLNTLPEHKQRTLLKTLRSQIKSPLVYILLTGALLSALLNQWIDAAVIMLATVVSISVGVWQEFKSSNIFEKLSQAIEKEALVIRDGQKQRLNSKQLLPGDIVLLQTGQDVPADCRVIRLQNLKTNEAPLTGESNPVRKSSGKLEKETPLAERTNMVFMGTDVVRGTGRAVVVATGPDTEIGRIAELVQTTETQKTALQEKMAGLAKLLSIFVLAAGVAIILIGILQGRAIQELLITAIAVSVAAIPEGLVPAISIILAISANRILNKQGLVKRLIAAETLGSTTVICTDKTGTLTKGEMVVTQFLAKQGTIKFTESGVDQEETDLTPDQLSQYAPTLLFANEAILGGPIDSPPQKQAELLGSPTDSAMLAAGLKLEPNARQVFQQDPRRTRLPFNSEKKYLASFHDQQAHVAGAPEVILQNSDLTRAEHKKLVNQQRKFAKQGFRLVAVAVKKFSDKQDWENSSEDELRKQVESDLNYIGLAVIRDPIRPDVKDSLAVTRQAGIKPILATGDHILTAQAVGKELGFNTTKESMIEGTKLDKLSEEELLNRVSEIEIYARVTPKHKIRIIKAWQKKNEVIAMTGDGINDAPALKQANIGIAVADGTDVTKEAADLVLLNNSFTIITEAVRQGRVAFDNIKKTVIFLLADSFTELGLVIGSLLLNLPLPITGLQILWINFVEDVFPGVAMGFEPAEEDVMKRKPAARDIPLVNDFAKNISLVIASSAITTTMAIFLYGYFETDLELEFLHTLSFGMVGLNSLIYIFSIKSLRKPIWRTKLLDNSALIKAVGVGVLLLLLAIYLPFLNKILGTTPLPAWSWLVLLATPLIQVLGIEWVKNNYRNS